ncbi:MAG: VCBS repeat-containing protein [Deltaproteobacteria bacterium]|nr:VCBS repeat-containing protein [Deltaproteobacteria bacterium]
MALLPLGCADGAPPPAPPPAVAPIPLLYVEEAAERLPSAAPVDGAMAAVADLDGDGWLDIVQPAGGGLRIFWNAGGSFEPAAEDELPDFGEAKIAQALAGDFDGDGRADLFLVGESFPDGPLLLQGAARAFPEASAVAGAPDAATSGVVLDIEGDGDLDLVLTATEPGAADGAEPTPRAVLLVNDGSGRFSDQSEARLIAPELRPRAVAAGDLDGDGRTDLFFSGDRHPHRLLLGDGQGVFRDGPPDALPAVDEPRGCFPALGDIDGDGSLDVFVPSAETSAVLLNDGSGRLFDQTPIVLGAAPGHGQAAAIADLDRDGHADLVVADPAHRLGLYRNDGAARLFDYSGSIIPRGPAVSGAVSVGAGDLDGDGDLDLFVSRSGLASPWLLVNWHPGPVQDEDGDGVPDAVDNCPSETNAEQDNQDARHFNCESGSDCAVQTGCELFVRQDAGAYLACRDAPLDWAAARAFCRKRGADLVVIDDAGENAFVAALAVNTSWIGLSDTAEEGTFVWVSGSKLEYASWKEGEPNDAGGAEDCVALGAGEQEAGLWNDADCAGAKPFVCEDVVFRAPADPGDACDTCPLLYDPDQKDSDDDGTGDACQEG